MRAALLLAAGLLFVSACNKPAPDPEPAAVPTPAMPWPPPGAEKSAPPPEVSGLFELVANGFNAHNGAAVAKLFVNELAFRSVSKCDDPKTIADVFEGRAEIERLASADRGALAFKGVTEGYLLNVPEGGKPGPCTARRAVTLYLARYRWELGGKSEDREAHFMRVGDTWFIAKL